MDGLYFKAKKLIDKAQNVLVVSHRKPDADTLGAAVSFRRVLSKKGKGIKLACVDTPGPVFSFLPHIDEFVSDFILSEHDLIIIVDAGASYMTNFHLKYDDFFRSGIPILNIDHHASNDNFGTLNIVDVGAPSTTAIVYRMLKFWGEEIDGDVATALMGGIYGDTGSFMHSNTSEEVYSIAADLMEKGAAVSNISKALFGGNSVSKLKLWGKVLEKAYLTADRVVMSVIKEEDCVEVGASPEQLSGIIDYLNMVPEGRFAVLINEDKNGNVKGSFRTRSEGVDLSRIAAVFGGGGHPKASGFSIPGRLKEEKRYTIVTEDMSKKSLDF